MHPMDQQQQQQQSPQDYSGYYQQRAAAAQPQAPPPHNLAGGGSGGGGGGGGGGGSGASSAYASYSGSHPMGYRNVSGETTRAPPPPPLRSIPTYAMTQPGLSSQPSPTATSPYYAQRMSPAYASSQPSPRNGGGSMYAQQAYYPQYAQAPQAVDMPRSLSYPNNYASYASGYLPSISTPTLVHPGDNLPSLARHGSTNSIATIGQQPNVGYSFASRLPLVDRPFKCDTCVQSFNRNHDLKRHKRIHLSVKPYGCEKCGKTFSRKDALRRHWMVRGCRGEEGATAPITPSFPPNGPPPALSPPSPQTNSTGNSSSEGPSKGYGANTLSFNHPGAPPPLSSLPPRQSSDQPSQIILTPNDVNGKHAMDMKLKMDVVIDPALSSAANTPDGTYFDVMRKDVPDSAASSTFSSRYAASPKDDMRHHPYRRALPSPSTLSHTAADGKPVFAMPFQHNTHSMMVPTDEDISKNSSTSGSPEAGAAWPRW